MSAAGGPRVRRARPTDASALTEIAQASKRHWGYPEAWIARWRPDLTLTPEDLTRDHVFVATEGEAVIGFYALRDLRSSWSLEHCWVRPEWIGRGVGRLLFVHSVSEVRRRRPGVLRIASDPHAEGFYRRMGAARVGEVDASLDGTVRVLPVLALHVGAAP